MSVADADFNHPGAYELWPGRWHARISNWLGRQCQRELSLIMLFFRLSSVSG
jgi:hypothetical protein